jgi:hypothetical protein
MKTLTTALLGLGLLSGCAVSPADRPVADRPAADRPAAEPEEGIEPRTSATTPAARTYRPGIATVQSASVVSLSSNAGSASAGGTARPSSTPTMAYRLKMRDGAMQDIVQAGERFQVGDTVLITSDGRLVRP